MKINLFFLLCLVVCTECSNGERQNLREKEESVDQSIKDSTPFILQMISASLEVTEGLIQGMGNSTSSASSRICLNSVYGLLNNMYQIIYMKSYVDIMGGMLNGMEMMFRCYELGEEVQEIIFNLKKRNELLTYEIVLGNIGDNILSICYTLHNLVHSIEEREMFWMGNDIGNLISQIFNLPVWDVPPSLPPFPPNTFWSGAIQGLDSAIFASSPTFFIQNIYSIGNHAIYIWDMLTHGQGVGLFFIAKFAIIFKDFINSWADLGYIYYTITQIYHQITHFQFNLLYTYWTSNLAELGGLFKRGMSLWKTDGWGYDTGYVWAKLVGRLLLSNEYIHGLYENQYIII